MPGSRHGPSHRGDPLPEVPSSVPGEYAEAYRAAYEKALRGFQTQSDEARTGEITAADAAATEAPAAEAPDTEAPAAEAPATGTPGTWIPASGVAGQDVATEYRTRPGWLAPVALAAVALVFVGCAYALGRMVSGGDESTAAPGSGSSTRPVDQTTAAEPTESPGSAVAAPKPWAGEVAPVRPVEVEVACTAPAGVDAAGKKVSYRAAAMIDGKTATAWRCPGTAIGQRIRIRLPEHTDLAEVGLIPGYAKTDAQSKVDRYAENNRITRVRWLLADGTRVEQALSGNPKDRSMRTIRVPATEGDVVTLEIVEVAKGKRNTTMISELSIGAAR